MQQYQKQGLIPNNRQALGSKDFEHIGIKNDLHKINVVHPQCCAMRVL
jgi:hypothetical protein